MLALLFLQITSGPFVDANGGVAFSSNGHMSSGFDLGGAAGYRWSRQRVGLALEMGILLAHWSANSSGEMAGVDGASDFRLLVGPRLDVAVTQRAAIWASVGIGFSRYSQTERPGADIDYRWSEYAVGARLVGGMEFHVGDFAVGPYAGYSPSGELGLPRWIDIGLAVGVRNF